MERYINQIVAIDTILSNPPDAHYPVWFAEQIANLPAADVIEVVYGRWVEEEFESYIPAEIDTAGNLVIHKYTHYKCSECGRTEPKKEPYCHCGARMDK